MNNDIIVEFSGHIVFSNQIQIKTGYLTIYIVRHKNSNNRLSSILVNQYTKDSIKPFNNGSIVNIKGQLLENYYKDKTGNYISKGLYILADKVEV